MAKVGPHVAVVDDEASVRTALGRLLRLADYEVAAFESGADFLASLPTRRPDCAIVDIHMPGLSGLEVQARLGAAHSGIPVVFITAGDEPGLEDAVRAAGGVGAAAQTVLQRRAARCDQCGIAMQVLPTRHESVTSR